jgi:hypothetical protein
MRLRGLRLKEVEVEAEAVQRQLIGEDDQAAAARHGWVGSRYLGPAGRIGKGRAVAVPCLLAKEDVNASVLTLSEDEVQLGIVGKALEVQGGHTERGPGG